MWLKSESSGLAQVQLIQETLEFAEGFEIEFGRFFTGVTVKEHAKNN